MIRRGRQRGRPGATSLDELDSPFVIGGLVALAALMLGVSFVVGVANLDVWTGTIVFLALIAGSYPVFRWIAAKEQDPGLVKILLIGLVMKFAFSLVRYFVIMVVYNKQGDAGVYHEAGAEFVRRWRLGLPIHPLPRIGSFGDEEKRIGDLTGIIYIITGTSAYAGFFIFSWLCYLGQVLMLRALRVAIPEADHRRYDLLVLFLPSLLFWPSSIGKEATMIFCLGLICYGGALLLAPRPRVRGVPIFAGGIGLVLLVRPHMALISLGSFGIAMAIAAITGRGEGQSVTSMGRAVRILALVGLLAASGTVVTAASSFFSSDAKKDVSAGDALARTQKQTSVGGSEFKPVAADNPLKVPFAVISVLFRPFPYEARNLNSLIAATEGTVLLAMFVIGWQRLKSLRRMALSRPYVIFVLGYVMAFSVAFSFVGNFGILARQRTQMLPMVLVLLALPLPEGVRRTPRSGDPDDAEVGHTNFPRPVGAAPR